MKKLLAIISIAVLAAACAKPEPTPAPTPSTDKVYVKFSANLNEDTKATIGQMKWEANDEITIWVKSVLDKNGIYDGHKVRITNIEDGTFEGEIASPNPEEDTFYAAYQASSIQEVNDTYEPVFNIPASQTQAADGATKAMLKGQFTGRKENMGFTMSAATAKLNITVTGANVKEVVFAGMNNEQIAGTSTTITYSGDPATDIEFIVPAMTFSKGYKVTYTNVSDEKMYQSYKSGQSVEFVAGEQRKITCAFVPFSISCAIDAANKPKTSYDYYLAGDITTANSETFETTGVAGSGSSPYTYDEDARGHYNGVLQGGKAKVVFKGASSAFVNDLIKDCTISEYGYKITYNVLVENNGDSVLEPHTEDVVVASSLSEKLSKETSWDVCGGASTYTTYFMGEVQIKPYIVVNGTKYWAENDFTSYITGLPHRSDHKDLWYIAKQGTSTLATSGKVSGAVQRHPDETKYPVDMFYANTTTHWNDYAVMSRGFSIPTTASINVNPVMYGVLWGAWTDAFATHEMNAYFYHDAAEGGKDSEGNVNFILHNNEKPSESTSKITNGHENANLEVKHANKTQYDPLNPKTPITLTSSNNHVNIYLLMYRGNLDRNITDYPGYWCRYIKVQYAAPSSN